MFNVPTVLVLGAGASAAAGLPLGVTLAKQIAETARDATFRSEVERMVARGIEPFARASIEALDTIGFGVPLSRSIDRFIEEHDHDRQVREMGKVLIAWEMLRAERQSHLARALEPASELIDVYQDKVESCWYGEFAASWLGGVKASSLLDGNHNLRVISFNYDRCFELYLISFIVTKYRVTPKIAAQVVESISVVHPYGSLGTLPLFPHDPMIEIVKFGGNGGTGELMRALHVSRGLRTFGESQGSPRAKTIRELIMNARQIVFLGFSYEPTNLGLLHILERVHITSVYASAYGVSEAAVQLNTERIADAMKVQAAQVRYYNATCENFVPHFAPTWR